MCHAHPRVELAAAIVLKLAAGARRRKFMSSCCKPRKQKDPGHQRRPGLFHPVGRALAHRTNSRQMVRSC